jgi:hypothetical protein
MQAVLRAKFAEEDSGSGSEGIRGQGSQRYTDGVAVNVGTVVVLEGRGGGACCRMRVR